MPGKLEVELMVLAAVLDEVRRSATAAAGLAEQDREAVREVAPILRDVAGAADSAEIRMLLQVLPQLRGDTGAQLPAELERRVVSELEQLEELGLRTEAREAFEQPSRGDRGVRLEHLVELHCSGCCQRQPRQPGLLGRAHEGCPSAGTWRGVYDLRPTGKEVSRG
jgi:hypothetical protein